MKVRIKKLSDKAVIPHKAHTTDAGFDLVATSMERDDDGCLVYGTGLAFEIPEGHVGLLFPRSSNAKKDLILTNSVGVIDSGYRGEVTMKFKPALLFVDNGIAMRTTTLNCDIWNHYYKVGDRIGQLIIIPYPNVEFEESNELSSTDRGAGGYGSTGK